VNFLRNTGTITQSKTPAQADGTHIIQNIVYKMQPRTVNYLYVFKDTKRVINFVQLQQMLKMPSTFLDNHSTFPRCFSQLFKEFAGQCQQQPVQCSVEGFLGYCCRLPTESSQVA
jgi:hypothetical protein